MKKVFSVLLASCTLLTSSPALAVTAPAKQPAGVFVTAPNPEWTSSHVESESSSDHREFHRNMVRMNLEWYAGHDTGKGTSQYHQENRDFREQLNSSHRQFHRDAQQAETPATVPETSIPDLLRW